MATWYRTGTVAVNNGSPTVTGTGTAWVTNNVYPGDAFQGPDGRSYEILSVNSETGITLAENYLGSNQTGQSYSIQPTRGQTVQFNSSATSLLATIQGYVDTVLAGKFGDGTAGAPSLTFASDTDTGMFRKGANNIGWSFGGTEKADFNGTTWTIDALIDGNAVQTSSTDTTAGRLLPVGAFGLGAATAPVVTDFDALAAIGFYTDGGNAATGEPASYSGMGLWHMQGHVATGAHQLALRSGAPQGWIRGKSSSVWGDWAELYTTYNLLGTVSQSSGVPTGAVIEEGSGANGNYVKFADGTMICWHTVECAYENAASCTATWTLPATFNAAPVVLLTPQDTGSATITRGELGACLCNSASTTQAVFRAMRQDGETDFGVSDTIDVYALAFGRWFA